MEKTSFSMEQLRSDWIKLAHKIITDGFIPDVIYASMRGGSFGANLVSECYKLMLPRDHKPILYAAVVAHSYSDFSIGVAGNVRIDGWTYSPDWLRPGDKILLIDDLWDSGETLTALEKVLLSKGIERKNLKVCVHDYKVRHDLRDIGGSKTAYIPDYYTNLIQVPDEKSNPWIHYESHELVGLTEEERTKLYTKRSLAGPLPNTDYEMEKVVKDLFESKQSF